LFPLPLQLIHLPAPKLPSLPFLPSLPTTL
jgi:hypothetical protein